MVIHRLAAVIRIVSTNAIAAACSRMPNGYLRSSPEISTTALPQAIPLQYRSIHERRDFLELTQIKLKCEPTGLLMIGGGAPKKFAQDIVVAAEILGREVPMHEYAVQKTVADVRDGALSGSTLKEASSWGKSTGPTNRWYCEATIALPLIAGYA
jgi:deoxyhypusine synthase